MSKLYLYNYNNYYNRIFKKEDTLADYGTPIHTVTANFNYNDGVDTYHDVNYNGQDGDYLIVTDDKDNIQSRWFIIENKRNRGGQHRLTLKRDLKVDLYDVWRTEDMIVHRGWPRNVNPIIFNSEGFSFNQIKEFEYPLRDDSVTPWYVIYFAKNCPNASGSINLSNTYDMTINTPISESVFADGGVFKCYDTRRIITNSIQNEGFFSPIEYSKFWLRASGLEDNVQHLTNKPTKYIWFDQSTTFVKAALSSAYSNKYSTWTSDLYFGKVDGITGQDRITFDNGSILIKDSTNSIYRVTINKETYYNQESYSVTTQLSDAMKAAINNTQLTRTGDWGDEAFGITYDEVTYSVSAVLETSGTVNWEINFTQKQNTLDADYNIIAIPKNDMRIFTSDNDWHIVSQECSQALLESILRSTYSDGGESKPLKNYIYDVQLLPYCPYPNNCTLDFSDKIATIYLYDFEYAPVRGLRSNQAYHNSNNDNHLFMLYVENAQYDFDIEYTYFETNSTYVPMKIDFKPLNYRNSSDVVNYKIDNECRVYRLCSPNYNGLFEFSVAKNNGINKFNVDVTLRPQNPYIHLNPNFKSLYGEDFNDARGLICQGDFSLPIVNDAWQTYEYQNKNYQNVFNRQMENLDFNQSQEKTLAKWNIATGALTGGVAGAAGLGMATGNPVAAVAGGILGAGASIAGGIADYSMLDERQEEQRRFAVDNYTYQLGNVKALAYSINKVTPLTNNNKIWPFLEIYDATSIEKDMLYKKLTYTSFTIEKIDKVFNYGENGVKHFFQATPIRFDSAKIPSHELNELAYELEKGVYI